MNGEIHHDLRLELPKGWYELINENKEMNTNMVAKLNAAIYGLTQAARVFYDTVRRFLVKTLEMEVCQSDGCLVTGPEIMVGLYVDDFLVSGTDEKIEWFTKAMEEKFEVSVERNVDEFIGVELSWTKDSVVVTQHRIVQKLMKLMKYDMNGV